MGRGLGADPGPGALADQVRFEREWVSLRRHAAARGIRLLGDLPIYVAPGSADVRLHPELLRDDAVAGVPPDAFSEDGQLWGSPLYDRPANRRRGYRWWSERFRLGFELFDATRIDHLRGFVAYWTVPRGSRTAAEGHWSRGPVAVGRHTSDTERPMRPAQAGVTLKAGGGLRGAPADFRKMRESRRLWSHRSTGSLRPRAADPARPRRARAPGAASRGATAPTSRP